MIYAINKRTKEHVDVTDMHMPEVAEFINGAEWKLTHADADGWIEWDGGECPLPDDAWCEVMMRDGEKMQGRQSRSCWVWRCYGSRDDIIAYRPILNAKPSEPEAPEWPQPGGKAELHNEPGYAVAYGDSAIGEEVEVLAVFYSGTIKMAAVEHDGSCYCFRAEMLRPIRSEEGKAVEEMLKSVGGRGAYTESLCCALFRAGYRKTTP